MSHIPALHECDAPGFDFKNDYCIQCAEADYLDVKGDSKQLKLWTVSFRAHRRTAAGPRVRAQQVLILGSDGDKARDKVLSTFLRLPPSALTDKDYLELKVKVEEVKGPFKNGSILSVREI